jgi:hypothetical protein
VSALDLEVLDTIGAHSICAISFAAMSGTMHQGRIKVAEYQGRAYGHQFRALELAYDLGQAQNSSPNVCR